MTYKAIIKAGGDCMCSFTARNSYGMDLVISPPRACSGGIQPAASIVLNQLSKISQHSSMSHLQMTIKLKLSSHKNPRANRDRDGTVAISSYG